VQLIGFQGNTTIGSSKAVNVIASALAEPQGSPTQICLLALDTNSSDTGLQANGAPKADFSGCTVFSDSNADCNGHNLGATYGGAVGTDSGCGITTYNNRSLVSDPYASLASSIPTNACAPSNQASTYPQEGKKTSAPYQLSGSYTGAQLTQVFCGDVALSGNVTITSGNAIITIENGQFDLGNYTIQTATGAGATIIFTGPTVSGLSPSHFVSGSGTLDIAAPTSGTWSGVSLYQDPNLPSGSGVDFTYAGNSPTWDVTGLTYFPNANVTIKGAVGKSSNGYNCYAFVSSTITISGTGSFFANPTSQCSQAGLTTPTANLGTRPKLVS
jgi:hypothetical protein